MASKKLNIVLVSRTESKLKALAQELGNVVNKQRRPLAAKYLSRLSHAIFPITNFVEQKYSVETKVFAMDFAKGADQDYQALQQMLAPVNVTVLGTYYVLMHVDREILSRCSARVLTGSRDV